MRPLLILTIVLKGKRPVPGVPGTYLPETLNVITCHLRPKGQQPREASVLEAAAHAACASALHSTLSVLSVRPALAAAGA